MVNHWMNNAFLTTAAILANILHITFTQTFDDGFTSECNFGTVPTFTKQIHDGSLPFGQAQVLLVGRNLKECSLLCKDNVDGNGRPFECVGFDYLDETSTCMLSGPIDRPFSLLNNPNKFPEIQGGFEALFTASGSVPSNDDDFWSIDSGSSRDSTGFYKKLCLKALSASFIPKTAAYSFEVTRQSVLQHSTDEVLHADTVEQCLGACLEARDLFDFTCRSALFYYETGDCLLNSLDKNTAQAGSFSQNTDGFIVDYFENHAVFSADCTPGSTFQWVRLSSVDLPSMHSVSMQQLSLDACRHFCEDNQLVGGVGDIEFESVFLGIVCLN